MTNGIVPPLRPLHPFRLIAGLMASWYDLVWCVVTNLRNQ